jgi:hypothetical protein
MPHKDFDFLAFIRTIKDSDLDTMNTRAKGEMNEAEASYKRAVKARKDPSREGEYIKALQGFRFILATGGKPDGPSEEDFQGCRPAIQALVDRGVLKPSVLSIFKA